jgi:hypothetical protein
MRSKVTMSLHAQLNPEALNRLRKQERNSTLSSLICAVLFLALVCIGLALIFLPGIPEDDIHIVTYKGPEKEISEPEAVKVRTTVQRKPSAPSSSPVRLIASNSASPLSIPIPEVSADMPSLDFGSGDDFGAGWDGSGIGKDGSGGSIFGSKDSIPGALKGQLFDLKQNRRGKEISYDSSVNSYAEIAGRAEKRRFASSAFSDYFAAPDELSLTSLAIPFTPAAKGPEYFGAKDTIKPSGWIAVYRGRLSAPESGRYRFRGASDDYMVALVNNRRNLVACWPGLHETVADGFREGKQNGSNKSPLGSASLHCGKWIDLKAGEPFDFTLAIGERPGGMVGFILEIEKEDETYRTAPDGRKILPLFTTQPFSDSERNEIEGRFGGYEFEWEKVPTFGIR